MPRHRIISLAALLIVGAAATSTDSSAQETTTGSPGTPHAASVDPGARATLLRADSALRSIRTLEYDAHDAHHFGSQPYPNITDLHVVLERTDTNDPAGARERLEYGSGTIETWDGTVRRRISQSKRTLIVDTTEAGRRSISHSVGVPRMFTAHGSLKDLGDDVIGMRSLGSDTADGLSCRMVQLGYRDEEGEHLSGRTRTLWFDTRDFLPRRAVDTLYVAGALLTQDLLIRNLRTNVTVNAATFAPEAPAGYTVEYSQPSMPGPPPLEVGRTAPDWTLRSGNGDTVSLRDLRGKVVLLDFWYSTCGPCVMAFPSLQKIHERYADRGVTVLGVNCREPDENNPAGFLKRRNVTYSTLLRGDDVATEYRVHGFPTLFIIDRNGVIARVIQGYGAKMEEHLAAAVDAVLAKQ